MLYQTQRHVFVDMEWTQAESSHGDPISIAVIDGKTGGYHYGRWPVLHTICSEWTQAHVIPQLSVDLPSAIETISFLHELLEDHDEAPYVWVNDQEVLAWITQHWGRQPRMWPPHVAEAPRHILWWHTQEWMHAHSSYHALHDAALMHYQWQLLYGDTGQVHPDLL